MPYAGSPTSPSPTLANGARAYIFETDRNTIDFDEKERESDAGPSYQQVINWNASPFTPAQISFRQNLRNARVHCIVTDSHDRQRLVAFAKTSLDNTTGKDLSDRNQGKWRLVAESKYCAPYLDENLDIGSATPAPNGDGLILIHAADQSRWRVSVDGNGSISTTPINSLGGVPSIPVNAGQHILVGELNGSLISE